MSNPHHNPPDPLIEEIRSVRRALSDQNGNDVDRLCAYLKEVEERYRDRVARPGERAGRAPKAHEGAGE